MIESKIISSSSMCELPIINLLGRKRTDFVLSSVNLSDFCFTWSYRGLPKTLIIGFIDGKSIFVN